MHAFLNAIRMTLAMMLLVSGLYTLLIWAAGLALPRQAQGSLVIQDGTVIGSELIGQPFRSAKYFMGRPSAVGYNAASTGGSNKGLSNPEYLAEVQARADSLTAWIPGLRRQDIPAELVTASGGGLDPHLSVQGARTQIPRVAAARGISPAQVEQVLAQHRQGPWLGLFGPETVSVLALNLALDAQFPVQ
jgi:K+-transporting ATPase ATPase C chain